ncbi:putative metal-binding motif-containing protein [Archangium sp.]|uniref:putative metal-binding motif-containing protein n=1 Tax=Archangium sp. TaxID=1872627 RepID=UPI00286D2A19|nr:putative metal-binding motif-containing protein [Archangium sp.]
MRLFLLAVGMLALVGCARETEPDQGAVRVEIFYATFRPGCLTVTALDEADASHTETQQLAVDSRRSDDKTVAVFRKADWSRNLRVTASAREVSCAGPEVATHSQSIEVPETGTVAVYLDLRAQDLDGDGFVSARASGKGTDCDDEDAQVYPGTTETCDGKDSNCSGNENDAVNKNGYYTDADGDGYGDITQVVRGCVRPLGTVMEAGDCNDADKTIHPGQPEQRCDGLDDDCDGEQDEDFRPGQSCTAELGCTGTRACAADGSAAVCVATQSPVDWFVDQDGDGRAGTSVGLTCLPPQGAKSTRDDCDDDRSRFTGGTSEVCDRLDNDCTGGVDEGVCAGNAWTSRTVLDASASWEAVATHGRNQAWLAGADGRLAHVNGATVTNVSGCFGDWKAAWARPSDGRVFLGSTAGALATTTTSGTACVTASAPGVTSPLTALVGFERAGVTTVYGVTSGGHVLRWEWREASSSPAPVVVAQVAANLRDVRGLGTGTLLAVGAESYQLGEAPLPRAFRIDTSSGTWVNEGLPTDIGTGFLNGVSVVDERLAYAVGEQGLLLVRENGTWRRLSTPGGSTEELLDVVAFDPTVVFVLSGKSGQPLHLLNTVSGTWSEPSPSTGALLSLDALGPEEQWAAGANGTLVRWGPP